VVAALILFSLLEITSGFWHVLQWTKSGGQLSLTAPLGFLVLWLAAWLVWRGNRAIWNIIAWLSPLALGCLLGACLAIGLGMPWKLLRIMATHEPVSVAGTVGYSLVAGLLLIWLAWETHQSPAAAQARSQWTRPPALILYGTVATALFAGAILAVIQGSWTKPAVNLARKELGDKYDYYVISWHQQTKSGQTSGYAVLYAYNETELRDIKVNW
jgi:heme A synthase